MNFRGKYLPSVSLLSVLTYCIIVPWTYKTRKDNNTWFNKLTYAGFHKTSAIILSIFRQMP